MNTLEKFEAKQLEKIQESKTIPNFGPGDTVKVNVRVKEGTRERIQAFEGVCIGRAGTDINATFTVRKISLGEGVERVFPLWSSRVDSIELVRRGSVRRAKLYYLRDRRGKSARISERTTGHSLDEVETSDAPVKEKKVKKEKAPKKTKAERKADKEARDKAKKAEKAAAKAAEKAAEEAAAEAPAEEQKSE